MVALVAAAARRWRETDGDGENLIAQLRGFKKSILFIFKYAFERLAFYFRCRRGGPGGVWEREDDGKGFYFLLSTWWGIQIGFDSFLVLLKPKFFNLTTKISDDVTIAISVL